MLVWLLVWCCFWFFGLVCWFFLHSRQGKAGIGEASVLESVTKIDIALIRDCLSR